MCTFSPRYDLMSGYRLAPTRQNRVSLERFALEQTKVQVLPPLNDLHKNTIIINTIPPFPVVKCVDSSRLLRG